MRKAVIYINAQPAGFLTEDEEGYHFEYSQEYVSQSDPRSGLQGWGMIFGLPVSSANLGWGFIPRCW
jgi:hypothetical protein